MAWPALRWHQAAQGFTQLGLENFQAWRLHNLFEQPAGPPRGLLLSSLDLFLPPPISHHAVVSLAPC